MLATPVILAAATSAAASLGFNLASQKVEESLPEQVQEENAVGFDLPDAEGFRQLLDQNGPFILTRPDATIIIQNKGRSVHLEVRGLAPEDELETLGRQLIQTVSQHYAYDRVMSDLKARGFDALEESTEEDGTIKLKLRRWDS